MKKKILAMFSLILMFIIIFQNVKADELKTQLDIIQKASETKYLENDQGNISKTIVDSNSETGEVTIELKLSNTAKEQEKNTETEIFLVIDNSGSMGFTTGTGEIRRNMIVKSVKTLVNQIYDNSNNVKVGLVRFANTGSLLSGSTSLMCNLTDNKQTMLNAINEYENLDTSVTIDGVEYEHCESGTNIEAGLKKANDNFSEDCKNKILILLTDGIPNASISYSTASNVYSATKSRLQTIENSGVSIISMMTGITDEDDDDAETVIAQIFGTQDNPTAGKFYNISDSNIQKIVTEDIYVDVMEKVQNSINTVKVVDYFPEDITKNFEFSYVGDPSIGTVSEKIDTTANTISWDIGILKGNEVAALRYKLKLKDMQNTGLLNKTIETNEKVVLTYTDNNAKDYEIVLASSPTIQLSEVKKNDDSKLNNGAIQNGNDKTASNNIIPQTGENLLYISLVTIMLLAIIGISIKLKNMKDIK